MLLLLIVGIQKLYTGNRKQVVLIAWARFKMVIDVDVNTASCSLKVDEFVT
jgi:hypothetical protein